MEKKEYIASKLNNLTLEFKQSIIRDEEGLEYTFEDYLNNYILPRLRDDLTFGEDDFFNNVETLIILQQAATNIHPYNKTTKPKINRNNIRHDIYKYISSEGYDKYLGYLVEYNNESFSTFDEMINEFIIPNIDDYGNVTEFGSTYFYKDFIAMKIKQWMEQEQDSKKAKKELKRNNLLSKYSNILSYPVNDIDFSLTSFELLIDSIIEKSDDEEQIILNDKKIKLDELLQQKALKAEELNNEFHQKYELIKNSSLSISAFEEFLRIANIVDPNIGEDSIICKFLFEIITNIANTIDETDMDILLSRLNSSAIKNELIKTRSIGILVDDFVANLSTETTSSDKLTILAYKQTLNDYIEDFENTEEFDTESSKKIYEGFSRLLYEMTQLLNNSEAYEDNYSFMVRMNEWRARMKSRYIYEDEKSNILSSYKRIKRQINGNNRNSNINDTIFALNSITSRIEELLELAEKNIKISMKDRTTFDSIIELSKKIKIQAEEEMQEGQSDLSTVLF